MNNRMLACVCGLMWALPASAQEPLPADVVAAWEKAGFESGWMPRNALNELVKQSSPRRYASFFPNPVPGWLPAFRLQRWSAGVLKGLPVPKSEFGLSLNHSGIDDTELAELSDLRTLVALDLSVTPITGVGLDQLRGLPIRTLHLRRSNLTDRGLKSLGTLKRLQILDASATRVSDRELKELTSLAHLKHLDLSETKVTDRGLKNLVGLKLHSLEISDSLHTDEAVKHLAQILDPETETVRLNGWNISDESLTPLAKLKKLVTLDLSDTQVTAGGLSRLAGLQLKKLSLPDAILRVNGSLLEALPLLDPNVTELPFAVPLTERSVKALQRFTKLQTLTLSEMDVSEEKLKEFATLKHLTSLSCYGVELSPSHIRAIGRCQQLTSLNLGLCAITDQEFAPLAGLKQLRELTLNKATIGDESLKVIAGFSQLRRLELSRTRISDAGVAHLAKLDQLVNLDLGGTSVGDAGLKALAGLKRMQILDLPETNVTDAGLEHLREMTQLLFLRLDDTLVTEKGVKLLAGRALRWLGVPMAIRNEDCFPHYCAALWSDVDTLDLRGWRIKDASLAELKKFRRLKDLTLTQTQITDQGLEALAGMNLRRLHLPKTLFTSVGLKHYCRALEPDRWYLAVTDWFTTDEGMQAIGQMRGLEVLYLRGNVSAAGWKALTGNKRLRSLSFITESMSAAELKAVAQLKTVRTLEFIGPDLSEDALKHFAGMRLLDFTVPASVRTDAGLKHYCAALDARVMQLSLSGWKLSDESLQQLAQFKHLGRLNLSGTPVSDQAVERLKKALPECEIIR